MSADNIYQMMFRSMTEIDEDYQCNPNEYCPKKKYGFIVDLNPQRTIAITDYIGQLLDKKDKNKEERQYKVLDLLNIDRDFYKSNFYNIDDDETKKEYSKQFFNKLVEIYDGDASNIYKELNELNFDIDLDFLKDIKFILKKFNFKHIIYKQGIDVKFKNKILEYKKNKNIKEDEEDFIKETIDDDMIIKGILSELIPILSFINGFDTYCIFNEINKLNKIELKNNLKNISNNEDLKEIFMEYMNDRFNFFDSFSDYLSFFNKLIDNIDLKKEIMEKKKGGSGEIVEKMETIMERIQTKMYNINIKDDEENFIKLINHINSFLKPTEKKKKENGEVFTPINLVQEMIGKLKDADPKIFTNPNLKWLDPASGMGNFPVVVYMELMIGLKKWEPDDEKRRKWILEEMLYMVEYDKTNVFMMRKIFCGNKYKLNIFHGSFIYGERYIKEGIDIFALDFKDIKKDDNKIFIKKINKFNGKFDVIMGNPPFNDKQKNINKRGGGDLLWNKFVELSLNKIVKNGFLLFIHPSGWRKPPSDKSKYKNLFNLMTQQNTMLYLEIHNTKDGMKIFNSGTNYDWYIIKITINNNYITHILDENRKLNYLNLNKYKWIANSEFELINKLIAFEGEKKCEILYSTSAYETRKKWVSLKKSKIFKYPIVHSTPNEGHRFIWSKVNNKGFFGVKKVIFGDSGIYNPIIDIEGNYGMSQHAIAIKIDNITEGKKIKMFLMSDIFNKILNACSWSSYQIDWRLFTYFKKNFYKIKLI